MWELSQTEGEVNHDVSVQIDFNFRIQSWKMYDYFWRSLDAKRCKQRCFPHFNVSHLQLQRQDAVDQIAVSHCKSPSSGCVWFSCWISLLVKLVNLYWTSTRCLCLLKLTGMNSNNNKKLTEGATASIMEHTYLQSGNSSKNQYNLCERALGRVTA